MNKTIIKKYAELIAKVGANVQKGQEVLLYASCGQYEFATLVAEQCYKCGASDVHMEWSYQPITKLKYKKMSVKKLSEFPEWEAKKWEHIVDILPCRIYILSDDPDGLSGVDFEKVTKVQKVRIPKIKFYREQIENKHQWTIAAIPSEKWAKKIFPTDRASVAVKKLWDAILTTCHITSDNDPISEWKSLNARFKSKRELLTSMNFDYLHYTSKNGTDFKVGLMPNSVWGGGSDKTLSGVEFNPNMPTEEVFTAPKKGFAEGRLVSTKPLSYNGVLIENFEFVFKDGKAVSYKAEKNGDMLEKMLSMDEGASYLGEVALVPKESGVNKSGILFYETLFDENASCHLAFGNGYPDTVKDFDKKSPDDLKAEGLNNSLIHVDFMVGADDLSVVGYKDGKPFQIFKDGTWAF